VVRRPTTLGTGLDVSSKQQDHVAAEHKARRESNMSGFEVTAAAPGDVRDVYEALYPMSAVRATNLVRCLPSIYQLEVDAMVPLVLKAIRFKRPFHPAKSHWVFFLNRHAAMLLL
jgi:hypothetical protein